MLKKTFKYFIFIGFFISLVLILYGDIGPYYKTELLQSAFSFATGEPQRYDFDVGKSEKFMVEIHLKKVFSDEKMNTILGDFVNEGDSGKIDLEWDLYEGDKLLAKGSNKEYGYSPIFGGSHSGLSIGEVSVRKGTRYTLYLHIKSINPDWDETEPYVEVGLHPARLEYLIGYSLLGFVLLIIFGPIVCYFTFKGFRKKSH
jgi:hypothetical protein